MDPAPPNNSNAGGEDEMDAQVEEVNPASPNNSNSGGEDEIDAQVIEMEPAPPNNSHSGEQDEMDADARIAMMIEDFVEELIANVVTTDISLNSSNEEVPVAVLVNVDDLPTANITQQQFDERLSCTICLKAFQLNEELKRLLCNHLFHGQCIVKWLSKQSCPVCRANIRPQQ